MIYSHSIELDYAQVPRIDGEISMKPFRLDTLAGLPLKYLRIVRAMIQHLPTKYGYAFLTAHGAKLKPGETLRRPGKHIDGNYLYNVERWGNGGGNDWKVTDSTILSETEFMRSYRAKTGGMLIISNTESCMGWNGMFMNEPKTGGDCSHIKELTDKSGFILKPNVIYYGNSQFIHESLPVSEDIHKNMVRITLPETYPWVKANTNKLIYD